MKNLIVILSMLSIFFCFECEAIAARSIFISDVNVIGNTSNGGSVEVTIENRESYPVSVYCGLTFISHDNLYYDQPYSYVRILKLQRKKVELKWKPNVGGHAMKPGKYITWIALWGEEIKNPNYKHGEDPPHLKHLLDAKIIEKKVRVYIK